MWSSQDLFPEIDIENLAKQSVVYLQVASFSHLISLLFNFYDYFKL
jgi:hypothetical protein